MLGWRGEGTEPRKLLKSKAETADQPSTAALVHAGNGSPGMLVPSSPSCSQGRDPSPGTPTGSPMEELLLLLIAVGLFAGNCISPRASADTAVGEQFLCIHGHKTMWAKLLKWRPRLCFEKQKISHLGLGSPLN